MRAKSWRVRVLPRVMLVAALCVFVSSCGGKGKESRGERNKLGDASRGGAGPDTLELSITLDAGSYAIGEPIVMALRVTNLADHAVTLTFPSAQAYDFIVRKGKKIIWQWSHGKMFAQVVRRHEMAPGETITHQYTWDQTTIEGDKPGLGGYTVQGVLATSPRRVTQQKAFGVAD